MNQRPDDIDEVKTGKNTFHQILSIDSCKICMAQDEKGEWVRDKIDKFCVTHSYKQTAEFCKQFVGNISSLRVKRHFENHSGYVSKIKEDVKRIAESTAMDRIDSIADRMDPDEVLAEIVTIGGRKVQSGDIEVDGKLLISALKEQGARRKFGSLNDVLRELDKVRFGQLQEGEIQDDTEGQVTPNL